MNYEVTRISGNSFRVGLSPATPKEEFLLTQNADSKTIAAFYEQALQLKFNAHIKVASLTQNIDFLFSATVELFSESGSI